MNRFDITYLKHYLKRCPKLICDTRLNQGYDPDIFQISRNSDYVRVKIATFALLNKVDELNLVTAATKMSRFKTLIFVLLLLLTAWGAGAVIDRPGSLAPMRTAEAAEASGDLPLAIGSYSLLIKEYNPEMPREKQLKYAEAFKHAGDLCDSSQRFIEALEFYTLSYQIAEKIENPELMMKCLGNIGNIYARFEDLERALTYYNRVYRLALKYNSVPDQIKVLINITTANALAGNIEAAKEGFRKLTLIDTIGQPFGEYHRLRLQGTIAAAGKNYTGAIYYYRQARRSAVENNLDSIMIANGDCQLGRSYMLAGNIDSAKTALNRALKISTEHGYNDVSMGAYTNLAELSRIEGDSVSDMKYKAMAQQIADSMFNRRDFNKVRNKLVEYEEMLQSTRIADLNTRLTIQWIIIMFVAVVLIVIGIAAAIIMRRNKQLRFANETLLKNNHELIESKEKTRVLMEKYLDSLQKEKEKSNILPVEKSSDELPNDDNYNPTAESGDTGSVSEPKEETAYLSEEQIEILLRRINRVLDDELYIFNSEFSLNMLAKLVKSNTKYVSWVINEMYGRNFKSLLNERRVHEASKRLEDKEHYGSFTIQAIAEEVGYKSSNSFIQSFKKVVGMTPAVYQKLAYQKRDRANESAEENDELQS